MCKEVDSIKVRTKCLTSYVLELTSFRHMCYPVLRIPDGHQFSSTSRHSEHVFFWTVSVHAQIEFIFRLITSNSELYYSLPGGRRECCGRVL
jgi:hypothetical protein